MKNKERIKNGLKEARLSLQEFEAVLQRRRHDLLATKRLRRVEAALRTNESPLKAAQRLTEDFFVPEPPSPMK
ncbi:hypothetical protein [Ruegeria sp. Alg231-54]|uniref:hypothetical protein n=1 Tax=Ruegeria sp. Alg231-54 TaxID=1922221 RepID=UPI000D54C386|nr:hypothetical protein [Ruegeria sp. Alg231-54]